MKKVRKYGLTAAAAGLAVMFLLPLLLTLTNSFMGKSEIENNYKSIVENTVTGEYASIHMIPRMATIRQYYELLLVKSQYIMMFWNSVFIVIPIVIGQIAVASMAAYAFAKLRFRWKEQIFFVYIAAMLMPFQVTLVPNYLVADWLGLMDKLLSIIFPGVFSAFGVFLLRQYMFYIPDEYIEAARVDGAGEITIFTRIVLPMSKNAIAALAILTFMDNWNMVEQPLVFLRDTAKHPLSVSLAGINMSELGVAFAASTIYMLPMLLIFLYAENYFIEGIQRSGIK